MKNVCRPLTSSYYNFRKELHDIILHQILELSSMDYYYTLTYAFKMFNYHPKNISFEIRGAVFESLIDKFIEGN